MNKLILNKKEIGDYLLSFLCLGQILLLLIQLLIGNAGFVSVETAAACRVIGSSIIFLVTFYFIFKRKCKLTIFTYLIWISFAVFSMIISPDNIIYISSEGRFLFLINIPIFLGVVAIYDGEIFLRVLSFISKFSIFITLIYAGLWFRGIIISDDYSMALGYGLLLPALYCIWKGGVWNLIWTVLLIAIIFMLGNRGAIITLLAYMLIKYLLRGTIKQKVWIILSTVLLILVAPLLFDYMYSNNIYSRSLFLLAEGNFVSHDSGRSSIYEIVWRKIMSSPYIGYGVFGDRPFFEGGYSHNLFLEIFSHFGVFLGGLLCAVLLGYSLKKMYRLSHNDMAFLFVFIVGTLIPLQVSSSYLINNLFPLLLGLIYRINDKASIMGKVNIFNI
jgi:O-antigen ligase